MGQKFNPKKALFYPLESDGEGLSWTGPLEAWMP